MRPDERANGWPQEAEQLPIKLDWSLSSPRMRMGAKIGSVMRGLALKT
jgi:hypothetical protein